MSRKVRRVPVVLDAGEIRDLPMEDIRMILRGADELISTGGRSMLAKILKGSRDKKILEYKPIQFIMYHSIVTVKFKMQKALRFLRKLLNKIEDLCLSLPVRSWSRIKHYHLYP